ncbi:MAG TPA: M48 family metallopeptidase [Longimicrobium sp.]|nr:M48 family metallopeptidase [Longimicrobium sp.]
MELKRIPGLHPAEYEHPFDKAALDALEKTRGLELVVRKFHEYGIERVLRIRHTGSNLKVTRGSVPDLWDAMQECCAVLDLREAPDLYVKPGDQLQGQSVGVGKPLVVVTTACVEALEPAEMRFMLGREVGHIKSQHALYHDLGSVLPIVADLLGSATMGVGTLLGMGLQAALLKWMRMSDYTADRAGLLACQDVAAATSALAKVAGLPQRYYDSFNPAEFVAQARDFESIDGMYDWLVKFATLFWDDMPSWAVVRAHEFLKWVDSGQYDEVLERRTRLQAPAPPPLPPPVADQTLPFGRVSFCPQCGNRIEGTDTFCWRCGTRLKPPGPALQGAPPAPGR